MAKIDIENITRNMKVGYIGIDGVARKIKKIYMGVDGVAQLFYNSLNLIDFEYTDNSDGTYTLTAWKGTLNGEPSTELVIPDDPSIII